jgi:hemerythrin-like domain-containing protein
MPAGPMKALEFAHTAIAVTTAEIDDAVRTASSPEVAVSLRERVEFLASFVKVHVEGEEQAMYPPLAAKVPYIESTFLIDHKDEEQLYIELEGEVRRCADEGSAARLEHLRRQVAIIRAISDSHIKKENLIVVPLVFEHFSVEEQAAMLQGIISLAPREQMPKIVPWMTTCQSPMAAIAYVSALSVSMPPPVFAAARGWIRNGVSAERWDHLVTHVPALRS